MRQFSSCVRNMKPKDLFFLCFFSNPRMLVLSDLCIFKNFVDLRMCKKARIPILFDRKVFYCYARMFIKVMRTPLCNILAEKKSGRNKGIKYANFNLFDPEIWQIEYFAHPKS